MIARTTRPGKSNFFEALEFIRDVIRNGAIEAIKKHSLRWVILPVSPSAEQFSRVIFLMVDKLLNQTKMVNGEKEVKLHSIIVHETETGYAQGFREDAYSTLMGEIHLEDILFSKQVKDEWSDSNMWDKLIQNKTFTNPLPK